jgi:hypothetical protein
MLNIDEDGAMELTDQSTMAVMSATQQKSM